ncbi:MAG: DNA polymerase, partial [Planctomycetota bacterium]
MEGTFFLVDGTALAYRSHFAFINNPLTNARGEQTSATFGYVRALLQLLEEEQPACIAVAFDVSRETFRKKMYPHYKATREKAPDELKHQFGWIKEITQALGIEVLEKEGFEADDLIGTAAKRATDEGMEVCIVSGDKDMMQLVGDGVRIVDPQKRVEIDAEGVKEKFGVEPDRVVDVLGLTGDTSDNVPGVPLIGPKKAASLIQKFGSLEEVLARAPEQKASKTTQNLVEFADQARLSKDLVTIRTDVPMELRFGGVGERDLESLARLFEELDFNQLYDEVVSEGGAAAPTENYSIAADLKGLVKELENAGTWVFDTETTGLDPYTAEMVGIAFSWQSGRAIYVPWSEEAARLLGPPLEDPALGKCAQNIKYDAQVLRTNGIEVRNLAFDTMIASYLLEPGRGIHNLDAMALRHLGIKKTPTAELIGKGKNQISMAEVEVERVAVYAAEDADCTWRLKEIFEVRLEEEGLTKLFIEVEMPLVPVLMDMERAGVRLDSSYLEGMSKELEEIAHRVVVEIHDLAGEVFNVNSPKQLGPILFDKLEIHKGMKKRPRRTRTGGY